MKGKKKLVSVFCIVSMVGMLFMGASSKVKASDDKVVDGSYLTETEYSEGQSSNIGTRGKYIMLGECSITKAGRSRIYVYASTTANNTVNYVATIGYVDEYNEKDDAWDQIHYFDKDGEDTYFVVTSQYLSVDSGKYYRVRADHFAGMEYPYEETYSFTDGILIN